MANVIINDTHLNNIADSIRSKNGTNTKYKPGEMATAISNITTGGEVEDLTSEFNTYETSLVLQETYIDNIFTALQGKVVGGTIETWTFTMEDGSTVEKEVVVE